MKPHNLWTTLRGSAHYHSYCGHGSTGIINTHNFLSHLYAAPTLEKHKDGSFIANEVWIGYYYCGH